MLRYNKVPTAVLVEICNLNNTEDRKELLTWKFRERLAHALAAGLAEGFAHCLFRHACARRRRSR